MFPVVHYDRVAHILNDKGILRACRVSKSGVLLPAEDRLREKRRAYLRTIGRAVKEKKEKLSCFRWLSYIMKRSVTFG